MSELINQTLQFVCEGCEKADFVSNWFFNNLIAHLIGLFIIILFLFAGGLATRTIKTFDFWMIFFIVVIGYVVASVIKSLIIFM